MNKGKCGICGDPFDEAVKPHEAPGGVFATGIITRTYTEGQIIPVKIDITALHKGILMCYTNLDSKNLSSWQRLKRFRLKVTTSFDFASIIT